MSLCAYHSHVAHTKFRIKLTGNSIGNVIKFQFRSRQMRLLPFDPIKLTHRVGWHIIGHCALSSNVKRTKMYHETSERTNDCPHRHKIWCLTFAHVFCLNNVADYCLRTESVGSVAQRTKLKRRLRFGWWW